jgi:L-iditol 2-dehydrogenase
MIKSKAATLISTGKIEIREFPIPDIDEESALLKMKLSGICGTDQHMFAGEKVLDTYLPAKGIFTSPPFPLIPGHENVGIISDIGEIAAERMDGEGRRLKKGDLVVPVCNIRCGKCYYCKSTYGSPWCEDRLGYGTSLSCKDPPHLFGGWSEYMFLLPDVKVFKVPNEIVPEMAVLTEPLAVALATFTKAFLPTTAWDVGGFGIGNTVIIQGLGPIGVLHAIVAKILGAAQVIMIGVGSESDLFREEFIERHSFADEVINFPDSEKRIDEALRSTNKIGGDIVVECTGNPKAILEGLEMVRMGGTYLIVGAFSDAGTVAINPAINIVGKGIRIIGINGSPYQDYGRALTILNKYKNQFKFQEIVTHIFKLEETEKAIKVALGKKCMKVAISP